MSAQYEDRFYYCEREYSLIRRAPHLLFDPATLGLKPDGEQCSASASGYYCDFVIRNGRLLLKDLYVLMADHCYPVIAGVTARWEKGEAFPAYKDLYLPVAWTGRLLVGSGFLREYTVLLGYQRLWAYQEVKELVFRDGRLIQEDDISTLAAQLRPLVQKADPFGLWRYEKTEPMKPYLGAWWV